MKQYQEDSIVDVVKKEPSKIVVRNYMAMLKNLRNVLEANVDDEHFNKVIYGITNEWAIKKSLVLPFRFLSAFNEIAKLEPSKRVREVIFALNTAVDISLNNIPKFEGENLVVLDVSGSMEQTQKLGLKSPHFIGSLFAAAMVKANNCDFMRFADNAEYVNLNPADSTITIQGSIKFATGGTNFHAIFQKANKAYDRIFILSDMQGWLNHYTPVEQYNKYKKRFNADPKIYSFDLAGLGDMQFPEKNVTCLAGFSEKIFTLISLMEEGNDTLVKVINNIEF